MRLAVVSAALTSFYAMVHAGLLVIAIRSGRAFVFSHAVVDWFFAFMLGSIVAAYFLGIAVFELREAAFTKDEVERMRSGLSGWSRLIHWDAVAYYAMRSARWSRIVYAVLPIYVLALAAVSFAGFTRNEAFVYAWFALMFSLVMLNNTIISRFVLQRLTSAL